MQHETTDIFARIHRAILQAIEEGAEKFRMPWHVTAADCFTRANVVRGALPRHQRPGSLGCHGVAVHEAGSLGHLQPVAGARAQVRKGEKAAPVVFWRISDGHKELPRRAMSLWSGHRAGPSSPRLFGLQRRPGGGYTGALKSRCSRERAAFVKSTVLRRSRGTDVRHGGAVACYLP